MSESATKQTVADKATAHQPQLQAESELARNRQYSPEASLASALGNRAMARLNQFNRTARPGVSADPLENEADRVAEQVLCGSVNTNPILSSEVTQQLKTTDGATDVRSRDPIRHGGRPMDASTRNFFESRFRQNFSNVRIHNDTEAHRSARMHNANAYTFGQHITFAQGHYQPESVQGKKLLAHELTHVLQQSNGVRCVQRQEPSGDTAEPAGVVFWYSVNIDRAMTPDELLLAFVMQYQGVDAAEAQTRVGPGGWHWSGDTPIVSEEDVRNGYKLIRVRDRSLTPAAPGETRERRRYYRGLSPGDRQAITRETDRRFWDRTQYRPGQRLGDSADDRQMADYWKMLRDELIRQRIEIERLPEEIRQFIFGETGPELQPRDYEAVLRVAEKLMQMSAAERRAYLERTSARTSDLDVFEDSIDRYMEELQQRREAALQREETKAALLGLDDVYRQYREYKSLLSSSATLSGMGARGAGTSLGMQPTLTRMREELTTNLQAHGYNSISDFEAAIQAFENAFRDEAVLIAYEMLDRYDHLLWTQQERYQNSATVRSLHAQLAPARGHFEEAHRIRREHASMVVMTPGEMADQAYWSGQFQEQMSQGRGQVAALSGDHPLLSNSDIPAEELALAGESDVQGVMQDYISERRGDVRETRLNIRDNPNLVWDLDELLQQAMVEQDIQPNSIYHKIIQDHLRDTSISRAVIALAVAVIAIAAGLVSMGGGTVAVLGAATAFGIGAYQAWEEFRRYDVQSAAHGAQLLSDDPSIAWVVVALVGAGLDLGGVAAALRPVKAAAQTFNRTGDLVELETELARLRELGEINDAIQDTVVRAARAEAEANEAWRIARARYYGRALAVIDPLVTPLINLAVHFTYPVYLSLRRGIISLERFLLTREAVSLIGNFRHLSPQQLAKVREAYRIAFANAQRVAAHGHSLGMLDTEIEQFLRMWNREPGLSVEDMMRQMNQWAEPLQSRATARARTAPDMILDPASRGQLPDFGRQIAGTGGIDRIRVRAAPGEGRTAVTIEGEILPGRLTRDPAQVTPTRRAAPDFNRSSSLFHIGDELGLDQNWQYLHLWGPGFGDEAAAGMMVGPRSVNLVWQNDSIESYIRQMAELSRRHGGRTRVRATAISWEDPTPSGWTAPRGEHFLKQAEYEITLIRPGQSDQTIRVTLEVAEPPATTIRSFSIDPPHAINLGDLFP